MLKQNLPQTLRYLKLWDKPTLSLEVASPNKIAVSLETRFTNSAKTKQMKIKHFANTRMFKPEGDRTESL